MPKFLMTPLIEDTARYTTRFGAANGVANYFKDSEVYKFVKFVGDSRYGLCAAGDMIEGYVASVESASADDYSIGSFAEEGRADVTFDGLQATPGTGTLAVGDWVVCGTVVALGTTLGVTTPRVCKATAQLGSVPADFATSGLLARYAAFAWRVVSLGNTGTGAVGTAGVIERVG